MRYLLSSLALLTPCVWLPRIQAGDLSSHVYNAWLAQLVAQGRAPGLSIQPQWTNVLFDLELSWLWRLGPAAAQSIAVAAAVLIFAWGAFAFLTVAARRRPWFLLPLVGMLSYGWVFHIGFFNFYLSLGLGFWALAIAWRPGMVRMIVAIGILALALVAHALPVLWAGGAIAYRRLSLGLRPRYRLALCLGSIAALFPLRWVLTANFPTQWFPQQVAMMTGADQVWVYGAKYHVLQLVLLLVWGILLARALERGWRRLALSTALQLAAVTAAALVILPDKILLPGYGHSLVFIAERMSLAVAICFCAVLATVPPRRVAAASIAVLAAIFCGFLYMDERGINKIEDQIGEAIRVPVIQDGLPRVVSALSAPDGRVDPLVHLIDRACIGHCFSYANYEPSTRQFRIRATPGNPVVVSDYGDSYALQTGGYKVKPIDLPLYAVEPAAGGRGLKLRALEPAESFQLARRTDF